MLARVSEDNRQTFCTNILNKQFHQIAHRREKGVENFLFDHCGRWGMGECPDAGVGVGEVVVTGEGVGMDAVNCNHTFF